VRGLAARAELRPQRRGARPGGLRAIALSRGPWILQSSREGAPTISVGFYRSIWVRDAKDGVWRVLYDGPASTPQKVADRAAAEKWVVEQPMADCSQS